MCVCSAVKSLREEMITLFGSLGGVHMQIGRVYPYLESQSPEIQALLKTLKTHLDPRT